VVLAISFSPYNSITPDLVAIAKERGAQIVSITDSKFSPLVKLSRRHLEVVESSHAGFRSLAGTTVMGMALVLAVARMRMSATDRVEPESSPSGPAPVRRNQTLPPGRRDLHADRDVLGDVERTDLLDTIQVLPPLPSRMLSPLETSSAAARILREGQVWVLLLA
jgi:hypothetical protein